MVKELRERTQLPMMECKRALTETDGDIEKAEELLRKSGALAAAKKAGRETAEGRVSVYVSDCGCRGGIIQVLCETAPVANTEIFVDMCRQFARHVSQLETLPGNVEELLGQKLSFDDSTSVQDVMNNSVNKLRENMQIREFDKIAGGMIAMYEHHNGQVAVVMQLDVDESVRSDERVIQLAKDLCMHVTAVCPVAVDRDGVPAEMVEKEKEIIKAQVEQQSAGKPANIIEKMMMGKVSKWYNERVLLEQPFVKDDKQTVQQVIDAIAKEVGKPITVKKFLRYEVGGRDKA
jgi:elongation factor Ts